MFGSAMSPTPFQALVHRPTRNRYGFLGRAFVVVALVAALAVAEEAPEVTDRWVRDSVVLGSWVAAPPVSKSKGGRVRGNGKIAWLHFGPTADCPHMLPVLPWFSCMDHWIPGSYDNDPRYGIRWDSTGWSADILTYRWVVFLDRKTGMGSDSTEGPRSVGRLRVVATPSDTSLEITFRGRRSILRRGPRPNEYDEPREEPDLELDRAWFDSLHRAALAPVGLVVPEPVRCLLLAHQNRSPSAKEAADTSCLATGTASGSGQTRTWSDPQGRWRVERTLDADTITGPFRDEIHFRLPDHWKWIWWSRRESALRSALTFVTGETPYRSPAMDNPKLHFPGGKDGGCFLFGNNTRDSLPWFTVKASCP